MVEGEDVSDDKLTWRLKLHDGLAFTERGVPVRAQDCVPSILRASKRWPVVERLMSEHRRRTARGRRPASSSG